MYRWPVHVLAEVDEAGRPTSWEECLAEVSPRGLSFTLRALCQAGHPTHIALIDAYLRGEVPFGPSNRLGADSQIVASRLLGPLVLTYGTGTDRLRLGDVAWLPSDDAPPGATEAVGGRFGAWPEWILATTGPDSELRGRNRLSDAHAWRRVEVSLPSPSRHEAAFAGEAPPGPIQARSEVRNAEFIGSIGQRVAGEHAAHPALIPPKVATLLRRLALGRSSRAPLVEADAVRALIDLVASDATIRAEHGARLLSMLRSVIMGVVQRPQLIPEPARVIWKRSVHDLTSQFPEFVWRPDELTPRRESDEADVRFASLDGAGLDILTEQVHSLLPGSRRLIGTIKHDDLTLHVALSPGADGGATLTLVPPLNAVSDDDLVKRMETAARDVLTGVMGVPFTERRKEPIEHRLIGPARTTTLLVGWSLVVPRNRGVFAAWLGSDGRVMIRLFPPEGQPARGRG